MEGLILVWPSHVVHAVCAAGNPDASEAWQNRSLPYDIFYLSSSNGTDCCLIVPGDGRLGDGPWLTACAFGSALPCLRNGSAF